MNRLLLIIISFACSIWLHAQLSACRNLVVQAEQIKLSECSGKPLENRNEIFSYWWDSNNVLHIIHKDVCVMNSNSDIEIDFSFSNDSILIFEKELSKEESGKEDRCLKDLSYQINMPDYTGLKIYMFGVLVSNVSSIHEQTFLISEGSYDYQITGKLDYQYQPFIMDGTCEWIKIANMGLDGLKQIISDQDTLILGKRYKKIFSSLCSNPHEQKYVGAIREENKQVFFISEPEIDGQEFAEKKIYDFNLKIGDKIELANDCLFPDTITYEVAFIDTIQVENIFRRKFYFYDRARVYWDSWAFDSWLEGIGGEYDLTHFASTIPTGYFPSIAGVWHNGEALFCDGYRCSCDEILPIVEHASAPDFRILQNPVKNKLLSIAFNEAIFSKLDFYFFDGQLQLTKELNTKDTTIEVSLAGFQAGNYILILTRKDGSRESCKVIVL